MPHQPINNELHIEKNFSKAIAPSGKIHSNTKNDESRMAKLRVKL
ncbi:24943_t:CDS:2 [Gigaspora margarita]|uniref:24943_t:CDS:1 n=1 Tax=Gigaspora margarita TaxID=4874 RepID=A0ABN7UP56_GIGMA|nr:24943_t:CDS:2 [Gigaspora margarita]